jgi:hypothetical protein
MNIPEALSNKGDDIIDCANKYKVFPCFSAVRTAAAVAVTLTVAALSAVDGMLPTVPC